MRTLESMRSVEESGMRGDIYDDQEAPTAIRYLWIIDTGRRRRLLGRCETEEEAVRIVRERFKKILTNRRPNRRRKVA